MAGQQHETQASDNTPADPGAQMALRTTDLSIQYGGLRVVKRFSFSIPDGQRVALIGPNGAGKSSIINALAGVVRPSRGSIWLYDREVTRWPTYRRTWAGIGRTFQNLESFASMSVQETLLVPLEAVSGRFRGRAGQQKGNVERSRQLLVELGLEQYGSRPVGHLPYGARKLVEVGRALALQPKVVLLDEPAAGLDSVEKLEFLDKLEQFFAADSTAVLLVEHDMPTVERLCPEHVIVLDAGESIAEGTFAAVTADERVVEAYLGTSRNR